MSSLVDNIIDMIEYKKDIGDSLLKTIKSIREQIGDVRLEELLNIFTFEKYLQFNGKRFMVELVLDEDVSEIDIVISATGLNGSSSVSITDILPEDKDSINTCRDYFYYLKKYSNRLKQDVEVITDIVQFLDNGERAFECSYLF